jgi:hypothetical protein
MNHIPEDGILHSITLTSFHIFIMQSHWCQVDRIGNHFRVWFSTAKKNEHLPVYTDLDTLGITGCLLVFVKGPGATIILVYTK